MCWENPADLGESEFEDADHVAFFLFFSKPTFPSFSVSFLHDFPLPYFSKFSTSCFPNRRHPIFSFSLSFLKLDERSKLLFDLHFPFLRFNVVEDCHRYRRCVLFSRRDWYSQTYCAWIGDHAMFDSLSFALASMLHIFRTRCFRN